jgi:hypothetical protein
MPFQLSFDNHEQSAGFRRSGSGRIRAVSDISTIEVIPPLSMDRALRSPPPGLGPLFATNDDLMVVGIMLDDCTLKQADAGLQGSLCPDVSVMAPYRASNHERPYRLGMQVRRGNAISPG